MQDRAILYPVLALVALIFVVFLRMFTQRAGHLKRNPPGKEDFATREAAMRYFAPVEDIGGNYINLFEMPVLFFTLAILLFVTRLGGTAQVVLAWAYVAARAVHSWHHVATRRIMARAKTFMLSCAILSAMWIGFAIDLLGARAPLP